MPPRLLYLGGDAFSVYCLHHLLRSLTPHHPGLQPATLWLKTLFPSLPPPPFFSLAATPFWSRFSSSSSSLEIICAPPPPLPHPPPPLATYARVLNLPLHLLSRENALASFPEMWRFSPPFTAVLLVSFPLLLPLTFLNRFPSQTPFLVLHPSLLPHQRGPSPIRGVLRWGGGGGVGSRGSNVNRTTQLGGVHGFMISEKTYRIPKKRSIPSGRPGVKVGPVPHFSNCLGIDPATLLRASIPGKFGHARPFGYNPRRTMSRFCLDYEGFQHSSWWLL